MQLTRTYNKVIDPLHVLILIPTMLIFYLLHRGTKQDSSRGVFLLLAIEWAICGMLFFGTLMTREHWVGWVGAGIFVAGGLFYGGLAASRFPPHFKWRNDGQTWLSVGIMGLAFVVYPLILLLTGRTVTYSLMPGSIALMSLGVMVSARPAPRFHLLIPALIYASVTPLTFAWWGVWEDALILPAAGLSLVYYLRVRKKLQSAPTKDTVRFDF